MPPPAAVPARRGPALLTPPTTPRSRPGRAKGPAAEGVAPAAEPSGSASRTTGAGHGTSPAPTPPASPRDTTAQAGS
eukprot:9950039-Lingulodinium_polyedra.AAC.1